MKTKPHKKEIKTMTTFIYFKNLEDIGGHANFMTKMLINLIYDKDGYRDFKKLRFIETTLDY